MNLAPGVLQNKNSIPPLLNPPGSHHNEASPVEVAAGLVFRDGKLLITQRSADAHLGGLWEFPGGKRERNETFEECLQRELMEELGIKVVVGELFDSIVHHYPERSVDLRFFHCRWLLHEPRPILCAQLAWIGPDELASYSFPAADALLLDKLRNERRFWT
jgi:mutator protein MutT